MDGRIRDDSLLLVDGSNQYRSLQDRNPDRFPHMIALLHSKTGEWTRKVKIDGQRINATTNRIDGAFAHARRFLQNHMVSQMNTFRYIKEFEFRLGKFSTSWHFMMICYMIVLYWGKWAKGQNAIKRLLHYMQLPFDQTVIESPDLPEPWVDISGSNTVDWHHKVF